MIFYILLFAAIIGCVFWMAGFILSHAETVTITWGSWGNFEISSTNFLIVFLAAFIVFYFIVWLLKSIFAVQRNVRRYRDTRLSTKAGQELTQGLVQFTSGHWEEAEELLLRNIDYAETPLLNYLAAARAAHMQESYDRRDGYLKKVSQNGEGARIAVAVSQADMQLDSQQVEQARATLVHLLELSPGHPYANKLLAKVYFKQEDWKHLFELLPMLDKQKLLKDADKKKFEVVALKGIFDSVALKKEPATLNALWRKLPAVVKAKPIAILNYCNALIVSGDVKHGEKMLLAALNKHWDISLVERFGEISTKI